MTEEVQISAEVPAPELEALVLSIRSFENLKRQAA